MGQARAKGKEKIVGWGAAGRTESLRYLGGARRERHHVIGNLPEDQEGQRECGRLSRDWG